MINISTSIGSTKS